MPTEVSKVVSTIETDAGKFLHFLVNSESKLAKAAPQVQAAALATLQSVITAVKERTSAAAAQGLNFTLDSQTITDVKAVVSNFQSDLKALGLQL